MKIRFVTTTLPLLFCSAVICAQGLSAAPPMKMGLWQSSVQMSGMQGMPNMPGIAGKPIVNQSCMTLESWQKSMSQMQSRQQQNANCAPAKVLQDAHKVSFDVECTAQQGYNTSVHVEMLLDSDEAMHGTSTVRTTGPAFPQGMSITASITSKYLGADCGSLKPGESKPVNQ